MSNTTRAVARLAFFATLAAPVAAQRSALCALPDTTQEWFTLQRTWLDDSKHDWSDDSLRQALVKAAGLDLARPLPVQRGWINLDDPAPPPWPRGPAILRTPLRAHRGVADEERGRRGRRIRRVAHYDA